MPQCPLCGKPATKTCGKCGAAAYCSTKCHSSDEALHYLLCQNHARFHQIFPRPPSTIHYTHILGLLFPDDSNAPQLVWVKLSITTEEENGQLYTAQYPKLNQYFGSFNPVTSQVYEFGAGYLDHTLEIWRQEKNAATCRQNQCVELLLAGCDASEWRKSILVLSKFLDPHQKGESLPLYQDITLSDLPVALRFIASEIQVMDAESFNPFMALDEFEWYRGVEICCRKDRDILGYRQFRQVKVKKSHPIFKKGATPDVSKHLGFPLLVFNQPPTARWAGKTALQSEKNKIDDEAYNMMISTDYDSECWNKVNKKWKPNPEITALVVRNDRHALMAQQVEVFVDFCGQAKELMAGTSDRQIREKLLKSQMNKGRFQEYFTQFKVLKIREGDGSWKEAVSPYES